MVGFLSTINRELCFPTKAEANLPATLEKIQRYVNRSVENPNFQEQTRPFLLLM